MDEKCFLYFLQAGEKGPIKIGIAKDVDKRLKSLQSGNHAELKVLKKFQCNSIDKARQIEGRFHNYFKHTTLKGEWFRYKPFTVRHISNLELIDDEIYDKSRTWMDGLFNIDIYNNFSDIDHNIQRHLENLVKDGNYNAVESIVDEIIESVRVSTGIKLRY